jgi:hypothetical protein
MSLHVHDSYMCPAHVGACNCPNIEEYLCNPYYVAGHCPDNIEVMPL